MKKLLSFYLAWKYGRIDTATLKPPLGHPPAYISGAPVPWPRRLGLWLRRTLWRVDSALHRHTRSTKSTMTWTISRPGVAAVVTADDVWVAAALLDKRGIADVLPAELKPVVTSTRWVRVIQHRPATAPAPTSTQPSP